jgi:hypothetical protein
MQPPEDVCGTPLRVLRLYSLDALQCLSGELWGQFLLDRRSEWGRVAPRSDGFMKAKHTLLSVGSYVGV